MQYLSLRYAGRLAQMGIAPSAGSVGDSRDDAPAESVIGPYETGLVARRGPWRHCERLFGPLGQAPPAAFGAYCSHSPHGSATAA